MGRRGDDGPGIAKSSFMSLAAFCVIDRLLAMKNQQLRLMIVSMTHTFPY